MSNASKHLTLLTPGDCEGKCHPCKPSEEPEGFCRTCNHWANWGDARSQWLRERDQSSHRKVETFEVTLGGTWPIHDFSGTYSVPYVGADIWRYTENVGNESLTIEYYANDLIVGLKSVWRVIVTGPNFGRGQWEWEKVVRGSFQPTSADCPDLGEGAPFRLEEETNKTQLPPEFAGLTDYTGVTVSEPTLIFLDERPPDNQFIHWDLTDATFDEAWLVESTAEQSFNYNYQISDTGTLDGEVNHGTSPQFPDQIRFSLTDADGQYRRDDLIQKRVDQYLRTDDGKRWLITGGPTDVLPDIRFFIDPPGDYAVPGLREMTFESVTRRRVFSLSAGSIGQYPKQSLWCYELELTLGGVTRYETCGDPCYCSCREGQSIETVGDVGLTVSGSVLPLPFDVVIDSQPYSGPFNGACGNVAGTYLLECSEPTTKQIWTQMNYVDTINTHLGLTGIYYQTRMTIQHSAQAPTDRATLTVECYVYYDTTLGQTFEDNWENRGPNYQGPAPFLIEAWYSGQYHTEVRWDGDMAGSIAACNSLNLVTNNQQALTVNACSWENISVSGGYV